MKPKRNLFLNLGDIIKFDPDQIYEAIIKGIALQEEEKYSRSE